MKKIKVLILALLLILLCGCTAKENIVMDDYGKISQKVVIPLENNNMTEKEFANYVTNILKPYNKALSYRNYKTAIVYDKDYGNIVFTNKFKSICSYIEKTVFSQYMYKFVKCYEDEKYIEIKNESEHIAYCSDCTTWPKFDDVQYSISLPVKALESNADTVDGTTYTWQFDKNSDKDKSFYLKISKKDLDENLARLKKIEQIKKIAIILLSVLFVIWLVLISRRLYKKNKNNKLDY